MAGLLASLSTPPLPRDCWPVGAGREPALRGAGPRTHADPQTSPTRKRASEGRALHLAAAIHREQARTRIRPPQAAVGSLRRGLWMDGGGFVPHAALASASVSED